MLDKEENRRITVSPTQPGGRGGVPDPKPAKKPVSPVPGADGEIRTWDHFIAHPDLPPKPKPQTTSDGNGKDNKG